MVIEPNYEKLVSSERKKLGVTQSVIECRLPANDGDVAKILCANAKSFILDSKVLSGEAIFNGNVNFQVIYENVNGETSGLDYTAEFKDKFLNSEIVVGVVPIVTSAVVDVNTTISGKEVKVSAIVEVCVEIIKSSEVNALTGVKGDNVFYNSDTLNLSTFLGVLADKFESTYDIEIKDNVERVLEVSCSPYIESVVPQNQFAKVVGGANIDICYVTSGENKMIRTHQAKIDFTQEVALDGLTENGCVQSMLNINNSLIKITTNIDSDYAIVNLNIPFEYLGYAFSKNTIEIVDDMFSTDNYLNISTTGFNTLECGNYINLESKVSGSVEVEDGTVDEVLGSCCNMVTLATSFIENGSFVLEGVASTTVLYLNKQTNTKHSLMVEMPFSINESVGDISDKFVPVVNLSLGEVGVKVKRGKDLDVSATLFVYSNFYTTTAEAVISNVEVQDEKPETESVLTIYIVKSNETIWEISKLLNVNPDALLEQNPDVELPLVGGEKLIVYRQKEALI